MEYYYRYIYKEVSDYIYYLNKGFFYRVYRYPGSKECILKLGLFSPSRTWKKTLNKSDSRIGNTKKS